MLDPAAISKEQTPLFSGPGCAIVPEIRVMAASGLWQDLRECLDQAEFICNDLLANVRTSPWCVRRQRYIAAVPWAGPALRQGGEGT